MTALEPLTAPALWALLDMDDAALRAATSVCSVLVGRVDGQAYDLADHAQLDEPARAPWAGQLIDRVRVVHGLGPMPR